MVNIDYKNLHDPNVFCAILLGGGKGIYFSLPRSTNIATEDLLQKAISTV